MEKVFISYSHKDEDWKERLVTHLGVMQKQGLLDIWDDRRICGGDDWCEQINEALESASIAILLISANFLTSDFILNEEVPQLLERRQEEGVCVIPLIVKPCAWKKVKWLRQMQARPKDGRALSGGTEHQIDADLAALAEEVEEIRSRMIKSDEKEKGSGIPPEHIYTAKLPTTEHKLFGRKNEIGMLDDAWKEPHTNILSFIAWGGVGKSALVNHWLGHMGDDNWRGAEKVYGWSFYSQGTREERQVSGDEFIAHALEWFGDKDPIKGLAWDKGIRLAELVRKQKTLLILDGLEPLQYPPGPMQGLLKDKGLQALLKELSRSNPGLCILTTREKVEDLEHIDKPALKRVLLENLSTEAGVRLLKSVGIKGTDKELRDAVGEFDGHALALNLLGTYLAKVHNGEIRKRDLITHLMNVKLKQGLHARKVMDAYENHFKQTAELNILYMMGLFDHPAQGGAIKELRKEPVIEGLTDEIIKLSEEDWEFAISNLRELRLLAKQDKDDKDKLDCHPLVREHFGEKLQKDKPEAWKEAHGRLYEYYKGVPKKELPDTLAEMEPLFAAVNHGCLAGRYQETLDDVYWERIQRYNEHYSTQRLGAFGADLAAVSCFFEEPWRTPSSCLIEQAKAFFLNLAGFRLRALGRFREAVGPMQGSLEARIKMEDWAESAKDAGNLSELYLTMGDVEKAVDYGKQSVDYADRTNQWRPQRMYLTTLADAVNQSGEPSKASVIFAEAEEMQKEKQPEYPYLYSVQGFQFCDLLISQGQYKKVQKRATKNLEWARQQSLVAPLDIGVSNLSLGGAYMLEVVEETEGGKKDDGRWSKVLLKAEDFLNKAVDGLREAGQQWFIPRALLTRAELYRYQQNWEKAWGDLEEAREIAERGEMGLYLADYHLEAARVCLAQGRSPEAREHWKEAAKRVEEMGYHRRNPEVFLIATELEIVEGNKEKAKETLKEAKKKIDEMGCHRWDIELSRLNSSI
ncbi:MAG: TIR domain-containing protein [Planctomycetota bacterium]|nr:MAG: TIR domain-containing protein [Planctomycetota bacterium]